MESESLVESKWSVGQLLEAKWKDGEYYYGKVVKIYNNGNYKFDYDDGEKWLSVADNQIRERTPIVPFGESDVSEEDEGDDSEEEASEESEIEEVGDVHVDVECRKYNEDALKSFLVQESKHYEYFLNGTTTSYGESFHSICNLYYPKGSTVALQTYIMKKCFAGFHWQELREGVSLSLMQVSFIIYFFSCSL